MSMKWLNFKMLLVGISFLYTFPLTAQSTIVDIGPKDTLYNSDYEPLVLRMCSIVRTKGISLPIWVNPVHNWCKQIRSFPLPFPFVLMIGQSYEKGANYERIP